MKKNYYKTIRHDYAIIGTISSIICLFFCIIYGYNLKRDELYVFYLLIILGIICIFWFIYSITYNTKRNVFMKKGKPISGYIIGAEEKKAGRGLSSYYLLISFNDEH
ncbi:MAG: hypothetical protein J6N21_06810, partial [Butyrivibrio sp.]|nr:hypothetical protein [Butyrivibrio sp.]